jgi:hypothetical protein
MRGVLRWVLVAAFWLGGLVIVFARSPPGRNSIKPTPTWSMPTLLLGSLPVTVSSEKSKNLSQRIVGIETTDKFTEPQIAAKVRQYFPG